MKKENKKEFEDEKVSEFQETFHIEGIGSVSSVGEYDMEKFIKRLLKSRYITG
ncbi:hypothetical protein J7E81_15330 [Bacillus sp. ISL-18]|uniref:hypothetical protein n=1 Tax=Bacillus sp. ISL-18 TaxID=2819118 RepID=UPI001BE87945|nr:hypothetical protein [Bacillus sp. ISL-18]MBT2656590.1 hypothetical protein [Bacillus sp. ISL-18]